MFSLKNCNTGVFLPSISCRDLRVHPMMLGNSGETCQFIGIHESGRLSVIINDFLDVLVVGSSPSMSCLLGVLVYF